jgi:hypothetical protein
MLVQNEIDFGDTILYWDGPISQGKRVSLKHRSFVPVCGSMKTVYEIGSTRMNVQMTSSEY